MFSLKELLEKEHELVQKIIEIKDILRRMDNKKVLLEAELRDKTIEQADLLKTIEDYYNKHKTN